MTEKKPGFFASLFGGGKKAEQPQPRKGKMPKGKPTRQPRPEGQGGAPQGRPQGPRPAPQGRPQQPPQGQPRPPQGQPRPQQPPQGRQAPQPRSGGAPQGRPQPTQGKRPAPVHDVERKFYNKEQSQEVYGKKSMEQNVFLYAPKNKFLSIQKFINEEYEGVVTVGTSDIDIVTDVFREKLNSRHVILFIETKDEFMQLRNLIGMTLQLKSENPDTIDINLAITSEIGKEELTTLKNSHLLRVLQMPRGFDQLSKSAVKMVCGDIVNSQPTYPQTETITMPKPAIKKKQVADLMVDVKDIGQLKEMVQSTRENIDKDAVVSAVEKRITYSKSGTDVLEAMSMIPEYQVLEQYKQELEEYLEMAGDDVDVEKLNEIMTARLSATTLQQTAIKEIMNTILSTKDTEKEEIATRNRTEAVIASAELMDSVDDTKKLIVQRQELKREVAEGFANYKLQTQTIANVSAANQIMIQKHQEELLQITQAPEGVRDDIREVATQVIQTMENQKMEMVELKTSVEKSLESTINYTNKLLTNYNVLIKLDDIIIERLSEDLNRSLTQNTVNVYNVDNVLKTMSKIVLLVDEKDLGKYIENIYGVDTLILTDLDLDFNERLIQKDVDGFINEESKTGTNVIKVTGNEDVDTKKAVINKMKLIATSFYKVAFIFSPTSDKDWTTLGYMNSVEAVYLTTPSKEDMVAVNTLRQIELSQNILGTTVVVNKYDASNPEELSVEEMRTLGDFQTGVKEIFLDSEQDDPTDFITKFRNLV